MIQEKALGHFRCTRCEEVVVVLGDDALRPDPGTYVCVYCLDPRQGEHDELLAAEAELHAIGCDMGDDCTCR